MKKNKLDSQQLLLEFDNVVVKENYSFQATHQESSHKSNNSTCKVISFNSFVQKNDKELLNRFYSLSNHLD